MGSGAQAAAVVGFAAGAVCSRVLPKLLAHLRPDGPPPEPEPLPERLVLEPSVSSAPSTPTRAAPATPASGSATPSDPADTGRGRAIREALRAENRVLKEKIKELESRGPHLLSIDDGTEPAARARTPDKDPRCDLAIAPGDYKGPRGEYPRACSLSVLAGSAEQIRVYDDRHVAWCVDQFLGADPDLGGEETLDQDLAPGVRSVVLAAAVPPDESNCGGCAISQPGVAVGPVGLWMKTTNTEGGFGGTRGRSEWFVPPDCDTDCRILFLHGGSYMWYSGIDQYYRPLVSRIAQESGMPVLSIDYRMAPEWKAPAGIEDALDALIWMGANGPDGPAKARKLFVTGDSSGGGMAVAVLLAAQNGIPNSSKFGAEGGAAAAARVHGCCAICPLTDLTYDFRRPKENSYVHRIWDVESRTVSSPRSCFCPAGLVRTLSPAPLSCPCGLVANQPEVSARSWLRAGRPDLHRLARQSAQGPARPPGAHPCLRRRW